MRGSTMSVKTETEFFIESCFACGCMFGMTVDFKNSRLRDKDTFYCPAGHPQHYTGKSDKELRREAEAARKAAEDRAAAAIRDAANARRQLDAAKREAKRQARRASAGVCPCCNRSFVQLARHMASKHPDHGAPS